MKKILTTALMAAVMTAALCATAFASEARLDILAPSKSVRSGDAFTVTVEVAQNPGLTAAEFTLRYDKEAMECTRVALGAVLEGATSAVNPNAAAGAKLAAASAYPVTGNGTLGVFSFRAKKALSTFSFSLENVFLEDSNGQAVSVTVTGEDGGSSGGNSGSGSGGSGSGGSGSGGGGSGSGGGGGSTAPVEHRFTDTAGHWAESYINTAAERGLFGGYADGSFRPNNQLTRAQFVTVLWNMAGHPSVTGNTPFWDIQSLIENYRKSITWAYRRGFISGTDPDMFSPSLPITRQAAMKVLFAYHGGKAGAETGQYSAYDRTYTDSKNISSWGRSGMYWAVYNGIMNGTSPTTLNPGGNVTRAQLAAIMVRYTDTFR